MRYLVLVGKGGVMRILFISETYPPAIGGVAKSAGRLSHALTRLGHQVQVLTFVRDAFDAVPSGDHHVD